MIISHRYWPAIWRRSSRHRAACAINQIRIESARAAASLRLIARRVRQRAFVVLNPCPIAPVDPAVARHASKKMLGLGDVPTIGALADDRAARSRFVDVRGNCHYATSLAADIGRPRLRNATIYES